MQTKDWRLFEAYLLHIHSVIKTCTGGALGAYFGKSGLAIGIMKALKKHINI